MREAQVHAWMTYRDIAGRIGLATIEAAAARVRRAKWPKRLREDTGEAEALVPLDAVAPIAKPKKANTSNKAAKPAQATSDLESLPKAMAAIPTKPSRATGSRWLLMYPDLGLRIGGRRYLWRAAREAIGRGVPLEQAAAIGRACRERNQPSTADIIDSACRKATP